MMNLEFARRVDTLKVLCLGAHSDDIEIGCGGTVLKLIKDHKRTAFDWVVLSADEIRRKEAEASAAAFLAGAGRRKVVVKKFRDGFFPYAGGEIKEYFEGLKRTIDPDLILTHCRSDLHQDHRLVSDLTWNTFRDHLILEYEIPKYDGDLGAPNVFVHLDEAVCRAKIRNILDHFETQAGNQWFTEDAFRALMRLRGIESNAPDGYAEAFHGRKLALG
ncbi:MAG: GlcNAc-PI de-N-acetylase [Candidatus Aminicenantes bacterium RBG_19FT_COMBO_58_17]|nr:MAG: GlcNAc-PI de-N-acetylase [Candidatus Aminicenantes bacterium RBG_19FT_COMBO_58_17]